MMPVHVFPQRLAEGENSDEFVFELVFLLEFIFLCIWKFDSQHFFLNQVLENFDCKTICFLGQLKSPGR